MIAMANNSIYARAQIAALRVLALCIAYCGQIRIKRFLDYDKNTPASQMIESRSCFYYRFYRRTGQPVNPAGEDHSVWHCVLVPIDQFRSENFIARAKLSMPVQRRTVGGNVRCNR
jgi:hypothetical protein